MCSAPCLSVCNNNNITGGLEHVVSGVVVWKKQQEDEGAFQLLFRSFTYDVQHVYHRGWLLGGGGY